MAGGSSWKISALISACYEFVLALFLLFQILLAVIVLEISKYLPLSRVCSYCSHGGHNLFCSGHFPALSPCVTQNPSQVTATIDTLGMPAQVSRDLLPGKVLSKDFLTEKKVDDLGSSSKKIGVSDKGRSLSLSSFYKRKKRTTSMENKSFATQACKGSVDVPSGQCIGSELELYDDLIEVSSEYLRQKDRADEEVIVSLLKALQSERHTLRILYEELEEERVASETAANEAMSMILRLQEEKSALQMEADHYRRMAEEKALHDEQAIHLLEEDLCFKEAERLRLEEELSVLRDRFQGDSHDVKEDVDDAPYVPKVGKPFLLLTGINEVSLEEENGNALDFQNVVDQSCVSIAPEGSLEAGQVKDKPLKKRRSYTVFVKDSSKETSSFKSTVENAAPSESSQYPEMCQLFKDDEDDAKTILVQLSALEKQLRNLEESERLDSWHQAQDQSQGDHLTCVVVKPEGNCEISSHAQDEMRNAVNKGVDERSLEAERFNMPEEEKVVNVDIVNVKDGSYVDDASVAAAEEALVFHEGQCSRSKGVQWEACEEEKHLDMPSFVPTSHLNSASTSPLRETCKPDVQSLQGLPPGLCEEKNWNASWVTLEAINMRLQALENESTLRRHRSVPSNHENMSTMLLRIIMQELQELLMANKNGWTPSEASPSINAHAKGELHKKRPFSDGPGQFS